MFFVIALCLGITTAFGETWQAGSHTVTVNIVKTTNAREEIEISYTPYTKAAFAAWDQSRNRPGNFSPLGDRKYWLAKPTAPHESWAAYPELWGKNVFTARLRSDSARDFGKLERMDFGVLNNIWSRVLAKFVERNRGSLEKAYAASVNEEQNVVKSSRTQEDRLQLWFTLSTKKTDDLYHLGINPVTDPNAARYRDFNSKAIAGRLPPPIPKTVYSSLPITKHTLLVTHASWIFDNSLAGKPAIDSMIARFKKAGLPVVYFMDNDQLDDYSWYTADRNPTLALFSWGGEFHVPLETTELTMVGGYYEYCFLASVKDAVSRHFLVSDKTLTINIPLRAVYSDNQGTDRPVKTILDTLGTRRGPLDFGFLRNIIYDFFPDGDDKGLGHMKELQGVVDGSEHVFNFHAGGRKIYGFGSGARGVNIRYF